MEAPTYPSSALTSERGIRSAGRVPWVAVSGCGIWGRNLLRAFADLGALRAVQDVDEHAAAMGAKAHGVPARSFDELLNDADIDAVAIATPAAQHARLAHQVLEAGKHVFVEKPLALEVAEAEELCSFADAKGLTLMVGHLLQYHPAFGKLEEMVQGGMLGRLQYLYSNRLNFGRIRREESILWSFAPHDISMMLRLAKSRPESVQAVGASFLHERIPDVTTTHMAFPSGIRGHVFVSWLHPFKEQKLVVIGDRGMAVFDDGQPWSSKLLHYPHEVSWRQGKPEPERASPVAVDVEPAEPLLVECAHFLSCVATGAVPRTDGREAIEVLRVLQAADRSMRVTPSDPASISGDARNTRGVFIHGTAVVDEDCRIDEGTRIWHFTHVLRGTHIGMNCVLGQNVMVGPDVTIGDDCKIENNVSIFKGVSLQDGVFCGPSAVFTNVLTPRARVNRKDEFLPTLVEVGASIGANATILCGHTVGAYSMIGAGAVVTQDVPRHALMVGVPARRVGWVSHDGERLGEDLVCPRSGRRYRDASWETLEEILIEHGSAARDREVPVTLTDLDAQRRRIKVPLDQAISQVLDHQQFILGPEVRAFEERLASYCGADDAVACASGTDALMLVLLAWGVGPGDAVFVPSFTFAATAEVVALLGATPVFVDVDENSFTLDATSLEAAVEAVRQSDLQSAGVIAVDLFGHPADYDGIAVVAGRHGLRVMADAAQSFGATRNGRSVGTLADPTATSFFPTKPLGCYGDGGAVLTSDSELAAHLRSLRAHGSGDHKYEINRVGLNSRLDTLQAAILLEKLKLLPAEIAERHRIAERYNAGLVELVDAPTLLGDATSAWAQYTIRLDARDQVAAHLSSDGIPSAIHYSCPLHRQPAYSRCPVAPGGLPVTETLSERVLSLPMHPYLSDGGVERVVAALRRALSSLGEGTP